NLSRNLGLVTGASVMGAVFASAVAASDMAGAAPALVARGMQVTFAVAGLLTVTALAIAVAGRAFRRAQRAVAAEPAGE
ncbi:hypothetical protein BTE77_27410, partial [Ensifer adhaerens]